MSYRKVQKVLPQELIELIQNYVDGECIYIPRKNEKRQQWGSNTSTKAELNKRNENIFNDYQNGMKTSELAEKYFLSVKSIQRIVLQCKVLA